MTLIMKSCVFTLVILFLWRVEEGAEACYCMQNEPQKAICNAGVVIRAVITGREVVDWSIKYNIEFATVFRGPNVDAVYTGLPCRAFLEIGKDYLLTGGQEADGTVHISMCNFLKPWDDLSDDELSVVQDLQDNCT